jgi:hypothetical protein
MKSTLQHSHQLRLQRSFGLNTQHYEKVPPLMEITNRKKRFSVFNTSLVLEFVRFCNVILRFHQHHHHHHHVHKRLGVFSVSWSSKWNWSLHRFLGRPMFLRPFGLYCNACFGILFVSILCTCCSHFSWYCFIFFAMFCAPVVLRYN